jgi:hypothetical protein
MALHLPGTAEAAGFSADIVMTGNRRTIWYWTASIVALAAYAWALIWILSSSTAKVYGFPVSHDLPTLIEITLQVGPMLAAFVMVLLLPVKDRVIAAMAGGERPGRRVAMTLAVSAASAVIIVGVTAAAILKVCEFRPGALSAVTVLWVAGELAFDLTLVGVFTSALYAIKRSLWAAILLFVLYVAIVVTVGPAWGITSYIGFGSTVQVMVTTYSKAPLYDGAAWLLRGYWTGITMLMLSVLYAFDRPGRCLPGGIAQSFRAREAPPRTASRLILILSVACIGAGIGLVKLQAYGIARYQTPSRATLQAALQGARETERFHLTHYDVRLNYLQAKEQVWVDGALAFRNGPQATRSAYFQLPGLMAPGQLQIQGGGDYRLVTLGKYIQVKFADLVGPLQELRILYRGAIRPAGAFDLAVQSKVLGGSFFLTDADLLLAARSAACLAPPDGECGKAENYLMSDRATGRVTVAAPERLGAVSAGDATTRRLPDGATEHVFTVDTPRLATFLVACAAFRESTAISASGVTVRVLRSAMAAADGDVEAPLGGKIVSYYETLWPAYPRRDLKIIETPTPLGEALAFDGEVAISDKIIASRSPLAGSASNLLEFVMAHEIAHQWWGFNVVPSNAPGRLFVLESMAQFAAYKFLGGWGILSEQRARQNEQRRYRAAHARLGNHEAPLIRSEIADEVPYNKGPYALLSIDQMGGGSIMTRLGELIAGNSYESHGAAGAEQLAAALIGSLPEKSREAARSLLYDAGETAHP